MSAVTQHSILPLQALCAQELYRQAPRQAYLLETEEDTEGQAFKNVLERCWKQFISLLEQSPFVGLYIENFFMEELVNDPSATRLQRFIHLNRSLSQTLHDFDPSSYPQADGSLNLNPHDLFAKAQKVAEVARYDTTYRRAWSELRDKLVFNRSVYINFGTGLISDLQGEFSFPPRDLSPVEVRHQLTEQYDAPIWPLPRPVIAALRRLSQSSQIRRWVASHIHPDRIAPFRRLLIDWRSASSLSHLPPCFFVQMRNLSFLSLARCRLHLEPGQFEGLSNLCALHLEDNEITDIPNNAWRGLANLSQLSLADNNLQGELRREQWRHLPSLRNLGLDNNHITGIALDAFEDFASLTILLPGNNISTLSSHAVERLTYVSLQNNPIFAHLNLPFHYSYPALLEALRAFNGEVAPIGLPPPEVAPPAAPIPGLLERVDRIYRRAPRPIRFGMEVLAVALMTKLILHVSGRYETADYVPFLTTVIVGALAVSILDHYGYL